MTRQSRFPVSFHLFSFAVLVLLAGCRTHSSTTTTRSPKSTGDDPVSGWFDEVAAARGLVFRHDSGHRHRFLFPETACGGAALVDVDNDGDLDAYLVQAGSLTGGDRASAGNQLYLNDGQGRFAAAPEGHGADDQGYGMGVAVGDYDRDGDVDLYVTNLGPNALLQNDGKGRFRNVAVESGVADASWSSSAAFVDYDLDGDLDLYVVNYVHWSLANEQDCYNNSGRRTYCGPNMYAPARDTLYANDGQGNFTDVSQSAGLAAAFGNGLGVVVGDLNNDDYPDIYVANDMMPNQLWINQGNGTFQDRALLLGCAVAETGAPKAGMGVACEDLDDDLDLDLLVVNLHQESDTLFRNEGGYFMDRSAAVGLSRLTQKYTRFGLGLADFDNDGHWDYFAATGRINHDLPPISATDPLAEPNLVLQGDGQGGFRALPTGTRTDDQVLTSRAAAFGDIDNDGGVDVLVVNRDHQVSLLRNIVPNRGHWLRVRVLNLHGSDAIGAMVRLTVGDRTVRREVRSAYSYCAANDLRIHVGLGAAETVDRIEVRWPSGATAQLENVAADKEVVIRPDQ